MAQSNRGQDSLLSGQRQAVERLKSSLFGADPYVQRKYILDFHREYRAFRQAMTRERLFAACGEADIVFIGDYHALPSCQVFGAEMLEWLASRGRPLALFVEMVFSRDQRALDDFGRGAIDDAVLRNRIHYDRDWGYAWDGYGRLLHAAKRLGVPVIAADAPPRGGLRMIRRRDHHAATKIAARLIAAPQTRAVVLFGESHMAKEHLPGEVRRELARHRVSRSAVVVVQNVEEIYWRLIRKGRTEAEAVSIGGGRYCVFNASPLAKYEAYRQTLHGWWQQEDEKPDFGPSVHHLVDLLVARLGLDGFRTRVRTPGGDRVSLVDLYPEVRTRRDRRSRAPSRAGRRRRLSRPGVVYRQGANRIEVYAFSLASAAEAAAHFLMAALRGRAGAPPEPISWKDAWSSQGKRHPAPVAGGGIADPALPLAGLLIDEAFVTFAVRFLDPGVPPRDSEGFDRGEVAEKAGRGSLASAAYLYAAASIRGSVEKDRRSARRAEDTAVRTGEGLGEAIYRRMRNRPPSPRAKSWLLEAARYRGWQGGSGAAKGSRLLAEAATHAGWRR